ncbi:hypothetical protein CTI12_AA564300 [Artemisia annua]|uniref:Reverse transcriptase domain, Reverse transcriptase zinc-binding domain protein n=1 Tax=Artemisia annua TaxID=35608 RepID=A0A2U1KU35_ARTAN|nr:hypothetical protein CTI12_AA564300 [Artemisia annua]
MILGDGRTCWKSECIKTNVVYKIGNGKLISLWYDNWSYLGPLINHVTHRKLYEARLKGDMTVSDLVINGKWNWPTEWYVEFPEITGLEDPMIHDLSDDRVVWRKADGSDVDFSVKTLMITSTKWTDIVQYLINKPNGNNMWSIIRRLIFAACVYSLWHERNCRIFRDETQRWEDIVCKIVNIVKCILLGLKVKDSLAVRRMALYLDHFSSISVLC